MNVINFQSRKIRDLRWEHGIVIMKNAEKDFKQEQNIIAKKIVVSVIVVVEGYSVQKSVMIKY